MFRRLLSWTFLGVLVWIFERKERVFDAFCFVLKGCFLFFCTVGKEKKTKEKKRIFVWGKVSEFKRIKVALLCLCSKFFEESFVPVVGGHLEKLKNSSKS